MSIDNILQEKLRLREDCSDLAWRLWERKSLNMHRGVLHWRPPGSRVTCSDLALRVREHVAANYRIAWWRGFAFGVVAEFSELPDDLLSLGDFVDVRNNTMGTWQWTILVCHRTKTVIGVHTWFSGFLTSTYRAILAQHQGSDFATGSFKKEKDRLMAFLIGVASFPFTPMNDFEPSDRPPTT